MTSLYRTALSLVFALVPTALACGGATPGPGVDNASEEVNAAGGDLCAASPPPNARCAAPCPNGFKGPSGSYSCECCAAPAAPDAGSAEVCGGPPANARCMACPGGGSSYKQINGQATCECCAVAPPDAGSGEICGGPPPNARCVGCPGGKGYKQINGRPTCECCSS